MRVTIDDTLGSEGIHLELVAPGKIRAMLAPSRGLSLVPNMLQFRCQDGGHMELEVETLFNVPNPRGLFDEYAHAATPDGEQFLPLTWTLPPNGIRNTLRIPATGWDDFRVGMQAPYPNDVVARHMEVWATHPHAHPETLGKSIEGRPIHALRVHDATRPPRWQHWVVNQHPGEGNARWRMKGMIDYLLSHHPLACQLRQTAEILFIPLLCPDGPANGWRRVNADGIDMNRCHRMEGPHSEKQTREAFLFQRLLETEQPDTLWCMHTWPGLTEPILDGAGPEFEHTTGTVADLIDTFDRLANGLMKPLRMRENPGAPTTWNGGPHRRTGMTTFLVEGGGEPAEPAVHLQAGEALVNILADFWR